MRGDDRARRQPIVQYTELRVAGELIPPEELRQFRGETHKGKQMQTSLIQFNQSASAIVTQNSRTNAVSVRLLSAKEYKDQHGLKGKDGTRQYNDYLRQQGRANTAGLAAALTSGELLVKGFRDFKGSMNVNFVKASQIKDPKAAEKPVITEAELELLAAVKASGLTVADLKGIAS